MKYLDSYNENKSIRRNYFRNLINDIEPTLESLFRYKILGNEKLFNLALHSTGGLIDKDRKFDIEKNSNSNSYGCEFSKNKSVGETHGGISLTYEYNNKFLESIKGLCDYLNLTMKGEEGTETGELFPYKYTGFDFDYLYPRFKFQISVNVDRKHYFVKIESNIKHYYNSNFLDIIVLEMDNHLFNIKRIGSDFLLSLVYKKIDEYLVKLDKKMPNLELVFFFNFVADKHKTLPDIKQHIMNIIKTASIAFCLSLCSAGTLMAQKEVKYSKIYYNNIKAQHQDLTIIVDNAVSNEDEAKFKLKIDNTTGDYILFKISECKFLINGKETQVTEKQLLISPYESGSRVVNIRGEGLNKVKSYEFVVEYIMESNKFKEKRILLLSLLPTKEEIRNYLGVIITPELNDFMVKIGFIKFDVNKLMSYTVERAIIVNSSFAKLICKFDENFYYIDNIEGKIRMVNDIGDGVNRYGKNSWENVGGSEPDDDKKYVENIVSNCFFKFEVEVNEFNSHAIIHLHTRLLNQEEPMEKIVFIKSILSPTYDPKVEKKGFKHTPITKDDVIKNTESVINECVSGVKEFISVEGKNVINSIKKYKLQLAIDVKNSLLKHKTATILNKYPVAKEYIMKLGIKSDDIDSADAMNSMGFSD